jgi:hypothetical protein
LWLAPFPVEKFKGKELLSMSDEGQIRSIDWHQAFPFTQLFRSFRIAIHLSKLALGLALLLAVYFGGRILDGVWPLGARALPGEIAQYRLVATGQATESLAAWRDDARQRIQAQYAAMLLSDDYHVVKKVDANETDESLHRRAADIAKAGDDLKKLEQAIIDHRGTQVQDIKKAYDDRVAAVDKGTETAAQKRDDKAAALKDHDAAILDAYSAAERDIRAAQQICGQGLFHTFFSYEIREVYLVVQSITHNQWMGSDGVVDQVYNFFAVGPLWLVWNHTVFFILFGIWFLLNWAVFGGAISRIAAVQFARDEKISVRHAMNFAVGKVLSFGSAPVIPVLIVTVIGLIVAVASLVGNVPFLGPIVVGALFFLSLLAGFVMTLVLLGTAGGFNLMYPTIAVEGSDSFDAISRSFSYVYARPWRMLFYTAAALVYGAATYIFVHYFLWVMLVLAHHFVSMGIFTKADNTRDLLAVMWPSPTDTGRLAYTVDFHTLSFAQKIGAFFIEIWVMLIVSFLGSFAISFYFSANTIIYFLMRRQVDSTEMDDVYLEQSEDDLETVTPPEPAAGTGDTTVTAPVAPASDAAAAPPPPTAPPSP